MTWSPCAGCRTTVEVEDRVVRVSAWTLYGELGERLHAAGWALPNLASLPHISVGGAVATGTHGSGDRSGSLAAAVSGLEVVDRGRRLRTVRRGDPDFAGQVVALGALGVWTHVHLDLEPTYDVRAGPFTGAAVGVGPRRPRRGHTSAYSVSLFTDWTGDEIGQAWLKGGRTRRPGRAVRRAPGDRADAHAARRETGATCTEQLGVPGPWHRRLPHFRPGFTPSARRSSCRASTSSRARTPRRRSARLRGSAPASPRCCRSPRSARSPPTTSG